MENNETLHIVASDLLDYSFKVEKAVKDGWTFSDLNMYCPRAWPHMFEAWMLKGNEFVAKSVEDIKEDFTKQQEVVKPATNVVEKTTKQVGRRAKK